MKVFLKIIVGLFILLAIFLLWALERVDYSPYFSTDYYQATRARLDDAVENLAVSSGALEVGFGKANLTPHVGANENAPQKHAFGDTPLAGYGARKGNPATGVHDSLFVKAVAVRVGEQTIVFTTLDALIVPQEVTDLATKDLAKNPGLERAHVLFSATHTHSGPGGWGEGWVAEQFSGKYNSQIRVWVAQQIVEAVRRAVADLQPGRFGHSRFQAPDFVYNRLVKNLGCQNSAFEILFFEQKNGAQAVLGVYAAHATVLNADNFAFSADYPGYWTQKIERETGAMAAFFAGTVGSHGPAGEGENFTRAQNIGESLADTTLLHLQNISLANDAFLANLGIRVDLPEHHVRASSNLRFNPGIGMALIPTDSTWINAARLNNLLWLTTPCDFSGELAEPLMNAGAKNGIQTIISSFNGSYVGYIIPEKYYHLDSYESRTMSWFGPHMGAYIPDLMQRIADGLTQAF
mgnify:CR=1 FL=1